MTQEEIAARIAELQVKMAKRQAATGFGENVKEIQAEIDRLKEEQA